MRTRSKYIFAGIILLALAIVGVSLLLNQGKAPGGSGLTVDKPQEVTIRILSAIPVEPWVRESAAKYNAEKHKVQGATVKVEITTMDGLIALSKWDKDAFGTLPADADPLNLTAEQKKALENFPTAWIADSRYLVELANVPYKARLGRDVFLTDGEYRARPLAISPMVWGIYKTRADALVKKFPAINWKTIHDAAMTKGGWADLGGDPAWGFFKPVIPNPQKNIGGLEAMVSAAGEYFNTTRIDSDSVNKKEFQTWLLELMKAVTGLGVSSYTAEDFALFGFSVGDGGLLLESDLLQNMQGMQNRWADSMNIYLPRLPHLARLPLLGVGRPGNHRPAEERRDRLRTVPAGRTAAKTRPGLRPAPGQPQRQGGCRPRQPVCASGPRRACSRSFNVRPA